MPAVRVAPNSPAAMNGHGDLSRPTHAAAVMIATLVNSWVNWYPTR